MLIPLLVVYFGIGGLLSLYFSRKNKDLCAFAIANRSLSTPVTSLTLVGTRTGAVLIMGTAATASVSGLAAIAYPLSASAAFILLGLTLAEGYNKLGTYTVPEFVGKYYGAIASTISALILTIYLLFVLGIQFQAAGLILNSFTPSTAPFNMLIFGLITILFVLLGGLWGVAYTDAFQLLLVYLGIAVVAWASLRFQGGLGFLLTDNLGSLGGPQNVPYDTLLGWFVASITSMLVSQGYVQRMFAAKSPKIAKKAAIVAGLLLIPMAFFVTIIGMGSRYMNISAKGEQAFIQQAFRMTPILSYFTLISIFAMIASSAENILHSVSMVVGNDLLRNSVRYLKSESIEKSGFFWVRLAVLGSGIVALLIAYIIRRDFITTWVFAASILGAGLFIPIFASFYTKAPPAAAISSMISALFIMLISVFIPIKRLADPTIVAVFISGMFFFGVKAITHFSLNNRE